MLPTTYPYSEIRVKKIPSELRLRESEWRELCWVQMLVADRFPAVLRSHTTDFGTDQEPHWPNEDGSRATRIMFGRLWSHTDHFGTAPEPNRPCWDGFGPRRTLWDGSGATRTVLGRIWSQTDHFRTDLEPPGRNILGRLGSHTAHIGPDPYPDGLLRNCGFVSNKYLFLHRLSNFDIFLYFRKV